MPTTIRPPAPSDRPALDDLRRAFLEFGLGMGLLDIPADLDWEVHHRTARLVTAPRTAIRVAERGGQIVGYALALFRIVPAARHRSVCLIDEVFVAPEARGAGTAGRLVRGLLDEAAARRTDRTQIRVLARNERAHRLWSRMGFRDNLVLLEYEGPGTRLNGADDAETADNPGPPRP